MVPGSIPLPDEPTIAHDGSIAFSPLLMRSPLPGAFNGARSDSEYSTGHSGVQRHEICRLRKDLNRMADAVERAAAEAGRPPSGPSCAAALVLKCPMLLLAQPESVASSHRALLSMLQVPHTRLAATLSRCPMLLLSHASDLQDTWACLQQWLGLPREKLAIRLLQQPQLLLLTRTDVERRMRRLAHELGWDGEGQAEGSAGEDGGGSMRAVCGLLRNQIQLLGADPVRVAAKIPALASALGVRTGVAHGMARRQPALLMLSESTLRRNLSGLHDVLIPPPPHHGPQSWGSSLDPVESEAADLDQALHPIPQTLSTKDIGPGSVASTSCPLEPGDLEIGGHRDPQDAPGLEVMTSWRPEVVRVAVSEPTLLTIPAQTLCRKLQLIAKTLSKGER